MKVHNHTVACISTGLKLDLPMRTHKGFSYLQTHGDTQVKIFQFKVCAPIIAILYIVGGNSGCTYLIYNNCRSKEPSRKLDVYHLIFNP